MQRVFGLTLPLALLVVAGVSGCFPYNEVYRRAMSGLVVDRNQRPFPGAQVVTCTADLRVEGFRGCPRRTESYTDANGRYSVPELVEPASCCFGEAPMPMTLVAACAKDDDGRVLRRTAGSSDERIEIAPPEYPYPAACIPEYGPEKRVTR